MGKRTVKQQMFFSIDNHFKPGVSKHNLTPGEREKEHRIHSYQYRDALRDTASEFAKFCKEEYNTRYVVDIKQDAAQRFLEEKSKTCSSNTLKQYQSRLNTLSRLCEDMYGRKLDWETEVPEKAQTEAYRTVAMNRTDWNALEKRIEAGRECDSKYAVKLAEAFGLRVSEAVKITPADIKENTLHIHQSKGGRSRDIEVRTEHQRDVLKELQEYREVNDSERILKVKTDSVNAYLKNNLEALNITQYSEHQTGVHAIRKMWATEQYEERRAAGMTHSEAWGRTVVELGHGHQREDLFRVYVPK